MPERGASPTERRRQLRQEIRAGGPLIAPGAFDAFSASILEEVGSQAVYVGSYAVTASSLAAPDIGLVGLVEMADVVRRIAGVTSVPLIVDGESGFGGRASVIRTVEELEAAGASAVHVEDHVFGKHTGLPVEVMSTPEMTERVRLAVEARADPELVIIARSDALNAGHTIAHTVERLCRYADAGADAVFVAGCTPDLLEPVRDLLPLPVIITNSPGFSRASEAAAGVNVVIHYGFSVYVTALALRQAARTLLDDPAAYQAQPWADASPYVDERLGLAGFVGRLRPQPSEDDDRIHG